MISAIVVAPRGPGLRSIWASVLHAANFDVQVTSTQDPGEAVQILRSIRFELVIVDLRSGDDAARQVIEFLRAERPQDLSSVLLISRPGESPDAIRDQARLIEGTGAELEMPILARSISRVMGGVIPELEIHPS